MILPKISALFVIYEEHSQNGFTVAEFYAECRRILDKEDVFGRRRFFIEKMLAISEYENFFILMQSEMLLRRLASKK